MMHSDSGEVPSLRAFDALADRCRWLADAHAADDRPQVIAAMCDLYAHLAGLGWTLPEGPRRLLQVHDAALDAELAAQAAVLLNP